MATEMTKSPCHNSGITRDGNCDVCMKPIAAEIGETNTAPKNDSSEKTAGSATAMSGTGDDTGTE